MDLEFQFDTSVIQSAYATQFENAAQYVANLFHSIFTNSVTVTIAVGYGEVKGVPLSGSIGASNTNGYNEPVSTVPGGKVYFSQANLKALGGQLPASASPIDGYIGISSSSPLYMSTTGVVPSGFYDLVSTLVHEVSEVMGRYSNGPVGIPSWLDFSAYSAPGVQVSAGSAGSYFSVDYGQTALNYFNNPAPTGGTDNADWAPGGFPDAFDANGTTGTAPILSATDLAVMQALGWQTNAVGTGTNLAGNGENDVVIRAADGTLSIQQLNADGTFGAVAVAGNNSITINTASATTTANLNGTIVNIVSHGVATVNGVANTAIVGDGVDISINGNSNTLQAGTYATARIVGNADTITLGAVGLLTVTGNNDVSNLAGGSTATVHGLSDTVSIGQFQYSNSTIRGDALTVNIGSHSYADVTGAGNDITTGDGDALGISGSGNTVLMGTYATLLDSGTSDTVTLGSNPLAGISGTNSTLIASGGTVNLANGASAAVIGSANSITIGNSAAATVSGSGNIVNAGTGDGIGLVGSHNTLNAGSSTTAVDYGDFDTVTLGDNAHLTVFGGGNNSAIGNNSTVAVAGNYDGSTMGSNSVALISGAHDVVWSGGTNDTVAISGANNTAFLGARALALDVGNSNTIAAGAGSAITNQGTNGTDSAGSGSTFLVASSSNIFLVNPLSAYVFAGGGIDTLKGSVANFYGDLIQGLASGLQLDITDLNPNSASVGWTGSATAGALSFTNGNQSLLLATTGAINPSALHLVSDGGSGTVLTYS